MNSEIRAILFMGLGFFVVFSGAGAFTDIQKTLLSSAHDDNPAFNVDGYTLYGVLYSAFALSIWFSPSAISIFGPRLTMLLGALLYIIPPVSMLLEKEFLLYVAGALNGIGSALLWTGSANYLVLNSSEKTLARNTGLFWLCYQAGSLPGNLFVFIAFRDVSLKIDESHRHIVLFGITGILVTGSLMFLLLRKGSQSEKQVAPDTPTQALKKAWNIARGKNMIIMFAAFAYTGLHLTFTSGVYGASIGFSLKLGEGVKKLVPLSAILVGCGEVIGGLIMRIMGNVNVFRINVFFTGAVICNILGYAVALLSLPPSANFGNTYDSPAIEPRLWLLLGSSFIFGLGDSFLHTQLYTLVGSLYPEDSAPAFSIFKFSRNIFVATSFYYSRYLQLTVQLIILISAGVLGVISFNFMNFIHEKRRLYNKE